jgi:hypothetical protein
MAAIDPDDLERIDQEIRINELKQEAEELAGGEMFAYESDQMPSPMAEQFWQHVVDYEKAPWTSLYELMTNDGLELPPPETLTDAQLSAKLGDIIRWMADRRSFLHSTDHLSDRELYTHLVEDTLHEHMKDMPYDEYSAHGIDLVSSGSDEDNYLYLKYYADEQSRRHWQESFPDDDLPAHEQPPYDRDRHLPKAVFPQMRELEDEEQGPES